MNEYSKLKDYLSGIGGKGIAIIQGIVKSVSGKLCEVEIGNIVIPDVRLRASELDDGGEMLVTPKEGSAVIVGSLSGDLSQLVVLQVDHIDSIVINGGELGGLINIEQLTEKLNAIEDDINSLKTAMGTSWVVAPQDGGAALKTAISTWASQQLTRSEKSDYEDEKIKH